MGGAAGCRILPKWNGLDKLNRSGKLLNGEEVCHG